MAQVDGTWACRMDTPLGEQDWLFTVQSDGATFTGTNSGAAGSLDVMDGQVDGNVLRWTMEISSPFPMKLDAMATVEGDDMEGSIVAGAFGNFPMTGKRQG